MARRATRSAAVRDRGRYPPERRVEVYARAVRGLSTLEPDRDRQLKYLEFVDIYAQLDDDELRRYRHEYPEETAIMNTFAERFIEQGRQQGLQQGMQQGMQQGEARMLIRQLTRKFGELPEAVRQRIEPADADTLLEWSDERCGCGGPPRGCSPPRRSRSTTSPGAARN